MCGRTGGGWAPANLPPGGWHRRADSETSLGYKVRLFPSSHTSCYDLLLDLQPGCLFFAVAPLVSFIPTVYPKTLFRSLFRRSGSSPALRSALKDGFISIGRWHQNCWTSLHSWVPYLKSVQSPKLMWQVGHIKPSSSAEHILSHFIWDQIKILYNFLLNSPSPLPFRSHSYRGLAILFKKWVTRHGGAHS